MPKLFPKKGEKKSKELPLVIQEPKMDATAVTPVVPAKPSAGTIDTLRGMRDVLPQESGYWKWINRLVDVAARDYQFEWIETPILEHANLFVRGVGKQSDIVEKEMYRFTDLGGEDVVLRPESTAATARAYVNHGMVSQPQPVKLYTSGPMFRYDRPQAGRYRQFHQFSFETMGEAKPVVDAELIILATNLLRDLGLPIMVQVNSIGTPASRENYKAQLVSYYRPHRSVLCEDCKRRLVKSPMRLLDCKVEACQALRQNAPQIVDWLDEDSKNHFMKVLEYLDEASIPYTLNPFLVRGLDYYHRTVFELVMEGDDERSQSALGGGGRYDGLIELIGGRPTPGCGFAIGIERVILALRSRNIEPPVAEPPAVFVAQLGEQAKRRALVLFEECRRAELRVTQAFVKDAIKAQMELANKLRVRFTVIVGQKEVLDGTVIIRDMDSGVQEIVAQEKLVTELKKKLAAAPIALPTGPIMARSGEDKFDSIDTEEEVNINEPNASSDAIDIPGIE